MAKAGYGVVVVVVVEVFVPVVPMTSVVSVALRKVHDAAREVMQFSILQMRITR